MIASPIRLNPGELPLLIRLRLTRPRMAFPLQAPRLTISVCLQLRTVVVKTLEVDVEAWPISMVSGLL